MTLFHAILLTGAISTSYTHKVDHWTNCPGAQSPVITVTHQCPECRAFFNHEVRLPSHKCQANNWHEVEWDCEYAHPNCKKGTKK